MTENPAFEWAALSDVGLLRANNEDAVLVAPDFGFAVLADGMGGYNAGEVASRMAVEGISAGLAHWLRSNPAALREELSAAVAAALEVLGTCVDEANRVICEDAQARPEHAGMGTTLVVALACRGQLLVGHVGDSRAYGWRAGELVQLTRDHSVLQEHIDAGLITPDQTEILRYRNLLTRGLGVEKTVRLDTLTLPMESGDIYLLCSDGLTEMVDDAGIAAILGSGRPLPEMASALIDQAKANGGNDNVTVALLGVGG